MYPTFKAYIPPSIRGAVLAVMTKWFPEVVFRVSMRSGWLNRRSSLGNDHLDAYWNDTKSLNRQLLIDIIKEEVEKREGRRLRILEYGSHVGVNLKMLTSAFHSKTNVEYYAVEPNNEAFHFLTEHLPHVRGFQGEDVGFVQSRTFPGCQIDISFVNAVFYAMAPSRVRAVCRKLASLSDVIIIGDEMGNLNGNSSILLKGVDYLGNDYLSYAHPFSRILSEFGFRVVRFIPAANRQLALTGFVIAYNVQHY